MSAEELQFFKFPTQLIRSGAWGRLSTAARTLYPVLLSFTDRNYSPVYPGSNRLLELTGFKQKASLRRAREELQKEGLIFVEKGSGRTNSRYHFILRFSDTPQGSMATTPSGIPETPPAATSTAPLGAATDPLRHPPGDSGYNQIHISIQNHAEVPTRQGPEQEPHSRAYEAARNECLMAGIPPTAQNVQKILSREQGGGSMAWNQVQDALQGRVSPGSLRLLNSCFLGEEGGWIRLSDEVPEYLKTILQQIYDQILFEPHITGEGYTERNRHWNQLI